jgi:hypothetical protein
MAAQYSYTAGALGVGRRWRLASPDRANDRTPVEREASDVSHGKGRISSGFLRHCDPSGLWIAEEGVIMGIGPTNKPLAESDELTTIHGISPDRASKFRASGIDTLQKLAEISDEKAESVAVTIKYVSAQMIRHWRTEAQERLSQPPAKEDADGQIEDEQVEWHSIASFSVAFQSRTIGSQGEQRRAQIVHRQGNGPQFFYEVDSEEPWRWILDRLGERVQPQAAPPAQPLTSSPARKQSIQVEIAEVRAFQPPQATAFIEDDASGTMLQGPLQGNEPFALETSVRLRGSDASARQACQTQLFARSLPPQTPLDLGSARCDALSPGKLGYRVRLPKISLPAGIYRLRVMVTVQEAGIASCYVDGPVLQVI